MKSILAIAVCLLLVAADDPKPTAPQAKPDDVKSIDTIIASLYDVISGPKGQVRDWDRFRSLFVPDARLIPVVVEKSGDVRLKPFTADEYVKLATPAFEKSGFFESEIARKTETFGAIAHVFSTYESRREKGAEPFARGINSIQLLKQGDRWYVVTIYWDAEREGLTIPAEYLPKK